MGGQLIFNPLPKDLSRSGVQTTTGLCVKTLQDGQVLGNTGHQPPSPKTGVGGTPVTMPYQGCCHSNI